MLITIIMPVFNSSIYLKSSLNTIYSQIKRISSVELLIIDDGSTDETFKICQFYESKYYNIHYLYQEHKGVSAARNLGLKAAKGKYIFFLDADDEFENGTLEKVTAFFETIYDEVDLVTYPIHTICQGRRLARHFRYQYLKESGIYDLRTQPYIGQTTMNIVVKNKFENNVLFDENQTFSEDQKYCCEVLKEKLKMGFCRDGGYLYYRSPDSTSGKLSGACYVFEQSTSFFESLFAEYRNVPLAFQGLFVNDFYWKLRSNILFPYYYNPTDYAKAVERLKCLLERCENKVILEHPNIDFFEKYYMLREKENSNIFWKVDDSGFGLYEGKKCYVYEKSMEIVITHFRISKYSVRIRGFLKSVFFQFYGEKPVLCAVENEGNLTRILSVSLSAHNYYLSHEPTQRFWRFEYECDIRKVQKLRFEVGLWRKWFPVHYYFMPLIPFSHRLNRYVYEKDFVKAYIDKNNQFQFETVKRLDENSHEIWLYYDCSGVAYDNGLLQFLHDVSKEDGIDRFYICSDVKQKEYIADKRKWIKFGSRKHKVLLKQATKVITAYIEENNIFPYTSKELEQEAACFKFEIIYLQHGILHIDMPWKYSPEKIIADRIVVSTKQETELWLKSGFRDEDLIKCRMPRYDKLNKKEKRTQKILFAPSWRSYLIGENINHRWKTLKDKFLNSSYYNEIFSFLSSAKLEYLLEKYGYFLEFKIHPIFSEYQKYFEVNSKYIDIISEVNSPSDYDLFITDFSSYMFDFLYEKIPVFLFIPDELEFKSGMNGYRNFDNDEEYWRMAATKCKTILEKLENYMQGRRDETIEVDFYEGNNAMDEIYIRCIDI